MPRILLSGPVLLGFADVFDEAHGRPTPGPLPGVTPCQLGGILLPFPCPHCGAACPEAVDPRHRNKYRDPERGFSFCPACRGRYLLHLPGMPLPAPLPPGASFAPARIDRAGVVEVLGPIGPEVGGLSLLGAREPSMMHRHKGR